MFKKVLFPTEFSKEDDKLLYFLKGMKKLGLKEVVLIHVSNPVGLEQPLVEKLESELLAILNKRAKILENSKIRVKTVLLFGVPHEEIIKTSIEEKVSVIVSGTRGKKLVEELVKGSTSELVGRRANVPVLLIRYKTIKTKNNNEVQKMGEGLLKNVLSPMDFSEGSEIALDFLKNLNRKICSEMTLLHIVDEKEIKDQESKESILRLDRRILLGIKVELENRGFKVNIQLGIGPVIAGVLDISSELESTLLVIGPHGKGVTKELFLGSVSQNLVRTTTLPVILVH
ncbi:MAG: universal stress protein [Actinomycetia bacterium]|nr:universal stress protein [Actinomycetes bacterium]